MIPIRRLSLSEQAHDRKSRQIKRFAAAAASTNGDEDPPSIRGKFTSNAPFACDVLSSPL